MSDKKGEYTPYLAWILFGICFVFAIATTVNYTMYDYFAYFSKPKYIWQAVSGVFMHGGKVEPRWYLWVHFGTNMLMILPLGIVIERKIGTRRMTVLFLYAWLTCSVVFKLFFLTVQQASTGISVVGYSFGPVGYYLLLKRYKENPKEFSKQARIGYGALLAAMLIMLCPLLTGIVSFCLHFSGVVVGSLYCIWLHRKKII